MISLEPGDCREVMQAMAVRGELFDACITDPPYDLVSKQQSRSGMGRGFMGHSWDGTGVAFDVGTWRAVSDIMRPGAHLLAFGATRTFHRMTVAIEDAGFEIRDCVMWMYGCGLPGSYQVTQSDFVGWGTRLKPAWEPIIVARKRFAGTVEANVSAHGTGALNLDGCRVPLGKPLSGAATSVGAVADAPLTTGRGRWPANVIHDGSDEVLAAFAPYGTSVGRDNLRHNKATRSVARGFIGPRTSRGHSDQGSCARFFYSAKAGPEDRRGSEHPTIKPSALMRYLCRLVTPPGGRVLDPFAGSGSTLTAAHVEGFDAVGIERQPEYQHDILRRVDAAGFGRMP